MATTRKKKKKKTTTRKKPASRKRITAKIGTSKSISVAVAEKLSALEMKGDRLVVRISRESHPEIFDIDKTIKQIHRVLEAHGGKRRMRDLCDFLEETEKSLQIILSNHLESALRKYLK